MRFNYVQLKIELLYTKLTFQIAVWVIKMLLENETILVNEIVGMVKSI